MKVERLLRIYTKRNEEQKQQFISILMKEQITLIKALETIANHEEFSKTNAQSFNLIAKKALEKVDEKLYI
ncbi:MAG: hypothetical protein Unbinned6242contig1001_29 [Prokaryotic dsDNA virus sp.]|nr:MAG: hypothetical protein Unbinned6242contig1001_29 [Prokaryotic dsDNA virus sp.]|tara:strand:+ start:3653 stop:3865 length:213 start_codon:yes stop_codon:yes gene_type:complete